MEITPAKLQHLCSRLNNRQAVIWSAALNNILEPAQLNTPNRLAAFLGQAIHESCGFSQLEENLNYSVNGLLLVFPKYFTPTQASEYARQPSRIANRVYANRMGNGDEASGDGWLTRGRGIFHHTGKANYRRLGSLLFENETALLTNPERLTEPDVACAAAVIYWGEAGCNSYADAWDIDNVSDLINFGRVTPKVGDAIGFAQRLSISNRALKLLTTE